MTSVQHFHKRSLVKYSLLAGDGPDGMKNCCCCCCCELLLVAEVDDKGETGVVGVNGSGVALGDESDEGAGTCCC